MKFEFNHLEKSVLDSLSKKGRVYLVGGIVRDMVMYQKVDYHDVDVEIYDLEIDEIIDILSQYGKVNEAVSYTNLDVYKRQGHTWVRRES